MAVSVSFRTYLLEQLEDPDQLAPWMAKVIAVAAKVKPKAKAQPTTKATAKPKATRK